METVEKPNPMAQTPSASPEGFPPVPTELGKLLARLARCGVSHSSHRLYNEPHPSKKGEKLVMHDPKNLDSNLPPAT
jgi:hypothetical protein